MVHAKSFLISELTQSNLSRFRRRSTSFIVAAPYLPVFKIRAEGLRRQPPSQRIWKRKYCTSFAEPRL
jgi:hypothetical protein